MQAITGDDSKTCMSKLRIDIRITAKQILEKDINGGKVEVLAIRGQMS